MNRYILVIVMAVMTLTSSAQTLKFGYLSYSETIKFMPQYVHAQKELDNLRKTYESELERSEQAFNRQYEEYIDGQMTFPENILMKRQRELQALMQESVAFKQEARRLLEQAEKELMQPVREQFEQILAEIGIERGYSYILNIDANAYSFINPEMGEDITEDVKVAVGSYNDKESMAVSH